MNLRPATVEDGALLHAWRNDPETRKNSRNRAPVSVEEHAAWLRATLAAPDRRLLIAEHDGVPVGTVRCDGSAGGQWELSWTVAPGMRGRGLGRQMVCEAASMCDGRVCAWIRPGNTPSEAIAAAAGMIKDVERDGFVLWRRVAPSGATATRRHAPTDA